MKQALLVLKLLIVGILLYVMIFGFFFLLEYLSTLLSVDILGMVEWIISAIIIGIIIKWVLFPIWSRW